MMRKAMPRACSAMVRSALVTASLWPYVVPESCSPSSISGRKASVS